MVNMATDPGDGALVSEPSRGTVLWYQHKIRRAMPNYGIVPRVGLGYGL